MYSWVIFSATLCALYAWRIACTLRSKNLGKEMGLSKKAKTGGCLQPTMGTAVVSGVVYRVDGGLLCSCRVSERLLALLRCAYGIVHQPLLADFHYRSCKKHCRYL